MNTAVDGLAARAASPVRTSRNDMMIFFMDTSITGKFPPCKAFCLPTPPVSVLFPGRFYLDKFINPYFNQRKDQYGGNTENRVRICSEIIKVLKKTMDFHVSCRINPWDVRKNGMTPEESIKVAKELEKAGADSIQLTARTISYLYDGNDRNPFLVYVDKLIDEVDVPIILGGSMRDMKSMNDVLNDSKVEFLSMSKPFVAQPDFLADWKANGDGVSICQSCNNCYSKKESTCFKFK